MNRIVVLIPHYKNISGLIKSLSSIGQNEKVDVLIVDDGSNVVLNENYISKNFFAQGNVFFMYLKKNSGIEIALNAGLNKIILENKYDYIARLDCGDLCVKNRFRVQESFLDKNKDITLVGSFVDFINTEGKFVYRITLPTKDREIRNKMYINSMHIHPTIMFRASMLKKVGFYPVNYTAAEDYALFFKVLKFFKVANINKVLVKCELNLKGISSVKRKSQTKNRILLIKENFYFGFYPVYGLIRNCIIYFIPQGLLTRIKIIFKRD